MRLSIYSALVLFILLVLASSLPVVSAGHDDADDIAFRNRVERMLADHDVRLQMNEQFHSEIRETHFAERLARMEETQVLITRMLFAILIAVLGLLFRDIITVLRTRK